jgi:molybdopterin-synthase adenylyltransferase
MGCAMLGSRQRRRRYDVTASPTPGNPGASAVATRPRLKGAVWERVGDELRVVYDRRDQLMMPDPDGAVATLLELLREGGRTEAELADALSAGRDRVPVEDIQAAIALLDDYRLLEDGDRLGRLSTAEAERQFSNLAFFESFASLACSREDFCRRLRDSHVLVLGTGGLNSNTIPHLCGLGVGRLTLLDRDAVEPRNFARQYLYRWSDIGARKAARAAEWIRAFDPLIEVEVIDAGVESPEHVEDLLDRFTPNVVAAGIDHPDEVDRWVNAACVPRGVPFVRGGMWVTEGTVWSVDPGRSACLECSYRLAPSDADRDDEFATTLAGVRLYRSKPRINRGIGPVAGLLGAFGAFELLRYLTRYEPPVYAANRLVIDFTAGCATRQQPWPSDPGCPVCGSPADEDEKGGDPREAYDSPDREHPPDQDV